MKGGGRVSDSRSHGCGPMPSAGQIWPESCRAGAVLSRRLKRQLALLAPTGTHGARLSSLAGQICFFCSIDQWGRFAVVIREGGSRVGCEMCRAVIQSTACSWKVANPKIEATGMAADRQKRGKPGCSNAESATRANRNKLWVDLPA